MAGPSLAAAGVRMLAAVVVSGAVAGLAFLLMIQGAANRGYTDLRFNRGLGKVFGAGGPRTQSEEALGIIGDPTGPRGFYATIALAIVLLAVHGLVIDRLARRAWYVEAIPLWILTYLLLALVYGPLVARSADDVPGGLFFSEASAGTPWVVLACALGFALIGSRCYSLIRDARWWEEKDEGLREGLAGIILGKGGHQLGPAPGEEAARRSAADPRPSLELPEERGEDGGVGPRG
jgi:hypothetical protein